MGWSLFRPVGVTHHNPAYSFKGFTLVTPLGGSSCYLLDMQGRVVHAWQPEGVRPEYAVLLPNGNLLYRSLPVDGPPRLPPANAGDPPAPLEERVRALPSNYWYLREADWDGNTLWQFECPLLHHDFFKTREGTYLVCRFVEMEKSLGDRVRGRREARKHHNPMIADEIVEIDRDGREIWSLRLDALFDPKLDPLGPLERGIEWTHTNSVCQSDDGEQLLISCKNNNRVVIVDKASKGLVWRFGDPVTSSQHHARWLPNGNVQIFDNGTRREGLPYSRVIEVNPKNDEIVWEYQANPPFSFFSPNISSAERLANGNSLVCEGMSGRVFEITLRGETVWEWQNPFAQTVRAGQTTFALWRAHRYAVDHPALRDRALDHTRYGALNGAFGLG